MALSIRFFELKFESDDYRGFLTNWFSYLKNHGGIKALKNYPGDYNAPYVTILALLSYIPIKDIYLIKGVSIISDFLLAISSSCLVSYLVKENKKEFCLLTYSVVLFLPSVIFNAGLWAQCDSIYASFVILALLALLKEKYLKSFILLGVSFSLKLQFIFVLPVFIVLYISKNKYSILNFFIIPIVNFILCLPAIIMGNPIKKIILVYFNQTKNWKEHLVMNYPNIYEILPGEVNIFSKIGILFTIMLCAAMMAFVIFKKVKWNNEKILTLALWFIVIVSYFLPRMHDRYMFVGEILAVLCYIVYKKNLHLVICTNIIAMIVYSRYLFGANNFNYSMLSVIYLIVIIYFTRNVFILLSNNKMKKSDL